MSDNRDKPPDPDATVSLPPRKAAKPDDDATVMMPRAKALEAPDEDATVTNITRDAFKAPDEDSTVMMPPGGFTAGAEAAAETAAAMASPATPPAAFRTDTDPEITATGVKPPPPAQILAAEPSRMLMIAGGIVVMLVVLYFVMSGGEKAPGPVASKPGVTAPSTPSAPPAAQAVPPSAPATPATAPAASTPSPAVSAPASAAAPVTPVSPSPAASPGGQSKVKELLAPEVRRGAIAIAEEGGAVTITIPGSQQFASGGVDPEAKLRPLLLSIAAALDKVPGAIVVTGHADATPSNNPKFPSNQELSAARAASAVRLMGTRLRDPKRIASQGASDSRPLAPSDTTENRAKNRRVAIVLKPVP